MTPDPSPPKDEERFVDALAYSRVGTRGDEMEALDSGEALEIFQQVHPTSREGGGTGIGLAICRKVVERHEGTLWLDSEPGEGTTVHFTLPGDGRGVRPRLRVGRAAAEASR